MTRTQGVSGKQTLYFCGSDEQRKALHEVCPRIPEEYDVKHHLSDREEPILHGGGMFAEGWRQIGHVFDPAFDSL